MVHLRLNDPDTSRNPYINFITSLDRYSNHADALAILQRLAALFRPIMKAHGLQINSLEEYEPNNEFGGRNWNAGENIEMVLRSKLDHTRFLPFSLICYVFAHELAHNHHMNHVPEKHGKLTSQLAAEAKELIKKGYFGDGFHSGGQRISDNAIFRGDSTVGLGVLPEEVCGGAWRRGSRKAGGKQRRRRPKGSTPTTRRKKGTPSLHTGAQTSANTTNTAGKDRRYVALPGSGSRVDGNNSFEKASARSNSYKSDPNSTFRKRATTNAARDLRAAAAMQRMAALKAERVEQEEVKDEKKGLRLQGGREADEDGQSSHTEDESVTESETESETEDELYEADAGPCGRPNESTSTSRSGNADSQETAASNETAEQRMDRTKKARAANTGGSGSLGWGELGFTAATSGKQSSLNSYLLKPTSSNGTASDAGPSRPLIPAAASSAAPSKTGALTAEDSDDDGFEIVSAIIKPKKQT